MNIGGTPRSLEIYAFAPGIDPASIDVQLVKGILTITGERKAADLPGASRLATCLYKFKVVYTSSGQNQTHPQR